MSTASNTLSSRGLWQLQEEDKEEDKEEEEEEEEDKEEEEEEEEQVPAYTRVIMRRSYAPFRFKISL